MKSKILPLLIILFTYCNGLKAQLYPGGTKLHVAHLSSYVEIRHQHYLQTHLDTFTYNGYSYTKINYPYGGGYYILRVDSNKLYSFYGGGSLDYLLFDFNAKVNDSITINQFYYYSSPPENVSLIKVKIDSIKYLYYYNELNEKDSLKVFFYSGSLNMPLNPEDPLDTVNILHPFKNAIIEKILNTNTSSSHSFLALNFGLRTLSADHTELRCIEFPDGKMIKTKWWYELAGPTLPCDYRFNVGQPEIVKKQTIQVYPNPAQDYLQLDGYEGSVTITNMLGQVVLKTKVNSTATIDIEYLPNGMYCIQSDDDSRLHQLFSIQH